MTDDQWRRGRPEPDPFEDEFDDGFGTVHFADEQDETEGLAWEPADSSLSLERNDTGSLPHWTAAPAGGANPAGTGDFTDDLDVWKSFASKSEPPPLFDESAEQTAPPRRSRVEIEDDSFGVPRGDSYSERDQSRGRAGDPDDARVTALRGREREPEPRPRSAKAPLNRPVTRTPSRGGIGNRDMSTAVGMGLLIGAVFVALDAFAPPYFMVGFAVLIVALAALEFFDKTGDRGYQPVQFVGIPAVAIAPAVAYWQAEFGIPLVLTLAFIASAMTFVAAEGLHSGPLPNMAITNLGVVYLGLLGSYAGLILRFSTVDAGVPGKNLGTDTLMLLAIGVVANDVGALFVGSSAGRTPLRPWISPNKTVEGFIGGLLLTVLAVSAASIRSDTWNGRVNVLVFGVGIGLLAPLGDLTESMFKRNLDIKDFGTLVRGHGGVLDRFDGFLFTLPFAYYLLVTLEPWTYVQK
jgi:phosphatidate cytidylyltransferase